MRAGPRSPPLPEGDINWLAAEQSNSSLIIADTVMLKIYRRISPGIHPEPELGRHLTEKGFANTPPLLGDVIRIAPDKTQSTLAIALGFVRNQGDAWSWTLDRIDPRDGKYGASKGHGSRAARRLRRDDCGHRPPSR